MLIDTKQTIWVCDLCSYLITQPDGFDPPIRCVNCNDTGEVS